MKCQLTLLSLLAFLGSSNCRLIIWLSSLFSPSTKLNPIKSECNLSSESTNSACRELSISSSLKVDAWWSPGPPTSPPTAPPMSKFILTEFLEASQNFWIANQRFPTNSFSVGEITALSQIRGLFFSKTVPGQLVWTSATQLRGKGGEERERSMWAKMSSGVVVDLNKCVSLSTRTIRYYTVGSVKYHCFVNAAGEIGTGVIWSHLKFNSKQKVERRLRRGITTKMCLQTFLGAIRFDLLNGRSCEIFLTLTSTLCLFNDLILLNIPLIY